MNYTQFSPDDFICDEYFQNWILKPDNETDEFWKEWLLQYPEKRGAVEQAKNILLQIRFEEDFPTEDQLQKSLASTLSIINSLKEDQNEVRKNRPISISRVKQVLKIAAVFIVIVSTASVILYNYWNEKITISTRYGEIKKFRL